MSSAEDGYCSADSPRADSADEPPAAAAADAEESPRARAGQGKRERDVPSPSSPLPAPKRSRRSVEKRVVSVRIGDRVKGVSGDGPPPADSWAWRKYGQKPIKGSPYPRGYYRCSSSKGCPARKQVERSRVDPAVLLVTYTFEHNHASPQPKSGGCHQSKPSAPKPGPPEPAAERADAGPEDEAAEAPEPEVPKLEREQKAAVTLVEPAEAAEEEEESFDLGWFDQYSWHRPALYASAPALDAAPLLPPEEWDRELQGEDALFAGLGELPECAVVFGRHRELSLAAATAPCS